MKTFSTRFSVRFFTVVLVSTGILLVTLVVYDYKAEEAVKTLKDRYDQIEYIRNDIIRFDEILTTSARMAAATGDVRWEKRYQEYEPKMAAIIRQAMSVSPEIYRRETDRSDIRKIKLLEMEHKAFLLIRKGHGKAAMDILFGKEYEAQENNYIYTVEWLNALLKKQMQAALDVEHSKEYLSRVSFITVLCLFLLSWLIILRIARRIQEDLEESNRQLSKRTQELNELNHTLNLANDKLKALYNVQKEFSTTLPHELRTPLASVKASIDIVVSGAAGDITSEQKDFLSRAKANVDRLNRLINDILDLAHMESDRVMLNKEPLDINKVILSVAETQETVARVKGLYLKTSLDPDIPALVLDRDKITEVLDNLVNNALKYTQAGGVTVSSRFDGEKHQVEVRVQDTGRGIKEEDIVKLFEKFQRLDDPYQKQAGTGLGLAICKEIIRQHGGTVGVESKKDQGSCFYFILPVE